MHEGSILIVDDNPMNLKLAQFVLDEQGYDVRTAGDSREALAALAAFQPSLILMDIQLPGMDGLEFTRLLKSEPATRHIVILALTAYSMEGDEQRARDAGCDGYIAKPIDTETLPALVKQHLLPKSGPKPSVQGGDYHDLLAELRNKFLSDGVEESTRLLNELNKKFNSERTLRLAHHWAGLAGTLGFPEIGQQARDIERSLAEPAAENVDDEANAGFPSGEFLSRLWTDLLKVRDLFSDALRGRHKKPSLPDSVLRALAGKTFAVIGFEPMEAERIGRGLAQAEAAVLVFDDKVGKKALQSADLLIVNAQEGGFASSELLNDLSEHGKPALFISSTEVSQGDLRKASDFLLAPWGEEEMALRIHRILTRLNEPQPTRQARNGKQSFAGPIRVVIADDDPAITALVSSVLTKFGVRCFVANDGEQALELARTVRPDVIVLDVNMPHCDGFGVLQSLKREPHMANVPVLMLTANNDESDVMRGFGYGADDYITKPFNPTEVAARVTGFASKRRSGSLMPA